MAETLSSTVAYFFKFFLFPFGIIFVLDWLVGMARRV